MKKTYHLIEYLRINYLEYFECRKFSTFYYSLLKYGQLSQSINQHDLPKKYSNKYLKSQQSELSLSN